MTDSTAARWLPRRSRRIATRCSPQVSRVVFKGRRIRERNEETSSPRRRLVGARHPRAPSPLPTRPSAVSGRSRRAAAPTRLVRFADHSRAASARRWVVDTQGGAGAISQGGGGGVRSRRGRHPTATTLRLISVTSHNAEPDASTASCPTIPQGQSRILAAWRPVEISWASRPLCPRTTSQS